MSDKLVEVLEARIRSLEFQAKVRGEIKDDRTKLQNQAASDRRTIADLVAENARLGELQGGNEVVADLQGRLALLTSENAVLKTKLNRTELTLSNLKDEIRELIGEDDDPE